MRRVWHLLVFVCVFGSWGCASRGMPEYPLAGGSLSSVKLGEIIYRDNFDDAAAGRLAKQASSPGIEVGYRDGEYLLRLSPSYTESFRALPVPGTYANTHVSVDVRLVGGTETRWIGVACRLIAKDGVAVGAYIFAVSPAIGFFGIARLEPDQFVRLIPYQFAEAVHRGNASNRLELTCAGSTILGKVNGVEVVSVQDSKLDRGYVAIVVDRNDPILLEGRFDNLVIQEALVEP